MTADMSLPIPEITPSYKLTIHRGNLSWSL